MLHTFAEYDQNPLTHILQDLVTAILDIMGLSPGNVNDSDSLAGMGIDSMQLVEVGMSCLLGSLPSQPLLGLASS